MSGKRRYMTLEGFVCMDSHGSLPACLCHDVMRGIADPEAFVRAARDVAEAGAIVAEPHLIGELRKQIGISGIIP